MIASCFLWANQASLRLLHSAFAYIMLPLYTHIFKELHRLEQGCITFQCGCHFWMCWSQALPLDSQHTLIERHSFLIVLLHFSKRSNVTQGFSHFGMPWPLTEFSNMKSSHIQHFCFGVHSPLLIYIRQAMGGVSCGKMVWPPGTFPNMQGSLV